MELQDEAGRPPIACSSERLIEFATDPDYAAVLQAVRAAPAEVGECASGERQAAERPGAASVTPAPSKAAGAAAGATAQVDAESPPGARLGKGDGTGAECRTVAEVPTLAEARASSAAAGMWHSASVSGATCPAAALRYTAVSFKSRASAI